MKKHINKKIVASKLLIIFILLIFLPFYNHAFLSIRIASWGPFELSVGLKSPALKLLGGAVFVIGVLISFFSSDSDNDSYYDAGYDGQTYSNFNPIFDRIIKESERMINDAYDYYMKVGLEEKEEVDNDRH